MVYLVLLETSGVIMHIDGAVWSTNNEQAINGYSILRRLKPSCGGAFLEGVGESMRCSENVAIGSIISGSSTENGAVPASESDKYVRGFEKNLTQPILICNLFNER